MFVSETKRWHILGWKEVATEENSDFIQEPKLSKVKQYSAQLAKE